MTNPFVLPTEAYKRDVDPIGHYIEQAATYLSVMANIPKEEALTFVKCSLKDGSFPKINNPTIHFLERKENGDRERKESTLTHYIYDSLKKEELIAPTITTYLNPKVKPSLLVKYIDNNVADRGRAKKEMFVALAKGDKKLAGDKDREQNNKKTRNNSLSGAQVSTSTPITNKTAHSTLTSTCRTTSGYGNANNEKFLSGNRHYWAVDIVINNIVSIINNTNYSQLAQVVEKYNVHIPTADEVMDCIKYSTDFYWRDTKGHLKIKLLVDKLNDLQRVAFVYTGDFYHFAKYNDEVSRNFITNISTKVVGEFDNALVFIKAATEEYVDHARQVCLAEMTGKTKNYAEIENTQDLKTLAGTTKLITDTINAHTDFIQAFWVTNNVPASVAYIPDSIRRSALTSDTDSTIFTVQDWVWWYYKDINTKPGSPVAASMIFIAAQTITHILAKMSANFGIEQKRLHQIAMKNEFKFDVFVPTNLAKHYYAIQNVKEGIILNPVKFEIKGVHLKNSNAPESINKKALDMMKRILNTRAMAEKINIREYLKEIADVERDIYDQIRKGSSKYLRLAEIKNPEAYSKPPNESPYSNHILWNEVFGPKYGTYGEPPYSTVRIATVLDSTTKMKAWMDGLDDRELADRMKNWLARNNKVRLPNMMIPVEALRANGMPAEILLAIDVRKIVNDITKTFYIIMETLGFYIANDKITRLISDSY